LSIPRAARRVSESQETVDENVMGSPISRRSLASSSLSTPTSIQRSETSGPSSSSSRRWIAVCPTTPSTGPSAAWIVTCWPRETDGSLPPMRPGLTNPFSSIDLTMNPISSA